MSSHRLPRFVGVFIRSPAGVLSLLLLAIVITLAVVAPILLQAQASKVNVLIGGEPPGPKHFLGTDPLGRDVLARTLVATRLSLELASLAALVAAGIGLPAGAAIGLLNERWRALAMRIIDALLSFPDILIAIFAVAALGTGALGAALGVGLSGVPWFARLAATLSLSIVGKDYVTAARAVGVSQTNILRRYILPNMAEPLVVAIALILGYCLIAVSSLSFLGIGVQPPDYDWGRLLTQGVQSIYETPLAALAPAVMIAVTGMLFGLAGDSLAAALNPMLWTARPRSPWATLSGMLPRAPKIETPAQRSSQSVGLPAPSLLRIEGLTVTSTGAGQVVTPVRDISFSMREGEILGIVGESGSGKTLTTLAISNLLPAQLRAEASVMELRGRDLQRLEGKRRRRLIGGQIAVIFQDPLASLNPALRIGAQMTEGVRTHVKSSRRSATETAVARLQDVLMSAPETRLRQYPHQLSGGMRQRVMIAMGLMTEPALIIADEPTTALDVTVQAQVIDVLKEANRRHGAAIILVSHNLAVVGEICDRVLVMYGGRIVEDAETRELLDRPLHPYSRALVASVPSISGDSTDLVGVSGQPPDLHSMPAGCPFEPRCPVRVARCAVEMPPLLGAGGGRRLACWVAGGEPGMEQASA